MFCLPSARPAALEMSASSVGSTRSRASKSSTLVPRRPYAEAISAPDAGERLRELVERPRLLRADPAPAELDARQRLLDRARGQDDALARLVLGVADADVAVLGDGARALDDVDLVLLEQTGDAARE